MEEIWKDVKNFEGIYKVSNLGRIKDSKGNVSKAKKKIALYRNKKRETVKQIGIIVAEAFIPNPNPKRFNCVKHLDENEENNNVDNLEWDIVNYRHGYYGTRIYHIWKGMKYRCYDTKCKQYHNYGGRGIKICDEWLHNPKAFIEWSLQNGYEEHLTIDRKKVDGNYEPSNCQWITNKEQQFNRRNNRRICYQGKNLTVTEWSHITGIDINTITRRLNKGCNVDEIFNPIKRKQTKWELEYEGEIYNMSSLARKVNMNICTLKDRIKKGMSVEDAISIPPSHSNRFRT